MSERPLPATLDAAVRSMAARLAGAGIEPAFTEARLIAELAGFDRMALLNAPAQALTDAQRALLADALEKRLSGMPVARIRGVKAFAGRDYALSPDTLEPRDDTETLIDAVAPFLAMTPCARILDIGTGTGIIALTLLARFEQTTALASDIAEGAVTTAEANARALGLGQRFKAISGDLFAGAAGPFDLIISNPPYIACGEIAMLQREVAEHDPLRALDGGPDGLDFYRRIAAGADALLAKDGRVAVEIGHDQGVTVPEIFAEAGFALERLHRDLGGRDRALVFRRKRETPGQ